MNRLQDNSLCLPIKELRLLFRLFAGSDRCPSCVFVCRLWPRLKPSTPFKGRPIVITTIHRRRSITLLKALVAVMVVAAASLSGAQPPAGAAAPNEAIKHKAKISIVDDQIRFSWNGKQFGTMSNVLLADG